ncbi:MAG: energy transducer TonB [Salibacteraceae bacterium]
MKRVLNVLIILLICANVNAQKVFWRSTFSQTNQPIGGLKSVKSLVNSELEYPATAAGETSEGSVIIVYSLPPSGIPHIDKIEGVKNIDLINETKRLFKKISFKKNKNRRVVPLSESFQIDYSLKAWNKLVKKRGYSTINYHFTPIDTTQEIYSYQLLEKKPEPIFNKKEKYRGFNDYIANKLQYPEGALKIDLKGEVIISFVIEQSGNISNIEVVKELGAGCTTEALRLIKGLKWAPGIKSETAVRTQMISSIGFGVASNSFTGAFNQGFGGR